MYMGDEGEQQEGEQQFIGDGEGQDPEAQVGSEEDPDLADRAKAGCAKIVFGGVFCAGAVGILWYNVKHFSESGGSFGGEHTQATVFGLAALGCCVYSFGTYLCLSPLADAMDALTDMVPCLPSCIEEMIDGMADTVVAFIAILSGLMCTLVITGVITLFYHPVAGGCMLAVGVCIFVAIFFFGNKNKTERQDQKLEMQEMQDGDEHAWA